MHRFLITVLLFASASLSLCAQEWTPQDSLRLDSLLRGEGEIELNPKVMKELGIDKLFDTPLPDVDKPWMGYDESLPIPAPRKERGISPHLLKQLQNLSHTGGGGGYDLMQFFTREYWDFKGKRRRARTRDVLNSYGDSTTVLWNEPLVPLK